MKAWLYERKRQDKTLTGPDLVQALAQRFQVQIRVGHVNYLLRQMNLSRPTGRPPQSDQKKEAAGTEPGEPGVDNAGIFFPGGG